MLTFRYGNRQRAILRFVGAVMLNTDGKPQGGAWSALLGSLVEKFIMWDVQALHSSSTVGFLPQHCLFKSYFVFILYLHVCA